MGDTVTRDIVAKLWNLCHILRDDGISYNEYVTELTYLLFLKMMAETGRESVLPDRYRWAELEKREGLDQLDFYRRLLLDLGSRGKGQVGSIFADAQTKLRKPTNLKALTDAIDRLDWFSAREEGLGTLYEGLLEKNAAEKKSGAGQYFTPRPLIDCIVRLMKPEPGEVIQDPAAGTGGFLVAADRYIKDRTDNLYKLSEAEAHFQRHSAFTGLELVPDTHRLCLMNLMLHGIEGGVELGDALSPDGERLGKVDLIMTNPPFGTKRGGGRPTRADFSVTADTSNKQLAFVEHVVRALKPKGRAAIVVPDSVLFEDGVGGRLRSWLLNLCNLHTVLRLPTGIFYAIGIKTNVIFFTRGDTDRANSKGVWVHDLRSNMDSFGKTRPLTTADFKAFEVAFGEDRSGRSRRKDTGLEGRFRFFSPKEIAARDGNLDISWLRDMSSDPEDQLTEPDEIASAIVSHLRDALDSIEGLNAEFARQAIKSTPINSKSAKEQLIHSLGLIDRYKSALLTAAFRGDLTELWRSSNHTEPVAKTLERVKAPEQPRGGRDASEAIIPGRAALSVNHPGTPAPRGWSWVSLNRIARQETGHTPSRSHPEWWGGDVPWIGIKDAGLHHGGVIDDTLQHTNDAGLENSSARLLPKGTVCLSRTASVGYVVIMGKEMATSQDFVTWTCTEALDPKFLMYALMAEGEDIRRFGKGSTHTTIYFPEVRAMHICLAPMAEQLEIVRLIEDALARIEGNARNLALGDLVSADTQAEELVPS